MGKRHNGASRLAARSAYRKFEIAFPALDCTHGDFQVGSDIFPGLQDLLVHGASNPHRGAEAS
jgi:hypothetical protein